MLALGAMVGCARDRYAGVDLRPGAAPPVVQELARDARAGDKRAQFALGERYEHGDGVAHDQARAIDLYRDAATDSGGTRMMFVPRGSGAVSAVPVNTGAAVPELPEARAKLAEAPSVTAARAESGSMAVGDAKPSVARLRAFGRLRALGPSDACTTRRALIQATSHFHILKCAAELYRFQPRRGASFDMIDLALTTDDDDAIRNLPIPFGLFDALELGIDAPGGAMGIVTYDVASHAGEQINIILSFVKGR